MQITLKSNSKFTANEIRFVGNNIHVSSYKNEHRLPESNPCPQYMTEWTDTYEGEIPISEVRMIE